MRDMSEPTTRPRFRPERLLRTERTVSGSGYRPRHGNGSIALAGIAAVLAALLHASPAPAVEFGAGELQGSLDTTLSHGVTFRVENRDSEQEDDTNGNDGNLNYDRGLVSNASKVTTDLDVGIGRFGAFLRATGFIDFENQNGTRERTPLSDAAKDRVGRDLEVLDAYVTGTFDAGDSIVDVRLGRHVLNWGESTFIQNGINVINPFDVSRLRTPGSELREALVPVSMISASVAPTANLSVESFYQLDWEETEIDPVGSYFSTTDYVGPGAYRAVVPVSDAVTDEGFGFGPLTPAINADLAGFQVPHPQLGLVPMPQDPMLSFDPHFLNLGRGSDGAPDDAGQWGFALRYLAEQLNHTEFGLYFLNHHSRLPIVSANGSSSAGVQAGLFAAQAVTTPGSNTVGALTGAIAPLVTQAATEPVTQAVTQEFTRQITEAVTAAVPPGTPNREAIINQQVAARLALPETRQRIQGEVATQVGRQIGSRVEEELEGIASGLAIDRYVRRGGGEYFIEYPEDNRILGLSFNTVLGASGWALQGEYSFHPDAPLQRAEFDLFAEGLAPILRTLDSGRPDYIAPQGVPGYLATYQPQKVQGYIERDVTQIQATATKVFGPVFGSDGGAFVTEVALMHVHGMPDQNEMRLESPAGGGCEPATDDEPADYNACAEATSWGYRMAARLDYNSAIGAVNLFPYLQFGHDVSGNSPAPSGSFVQGRTALTLGLRADYLARWQAEIGYTRYAGDKNELRDRDFISASVKYSF